MSEQVNEMPDWVATAHDFYTYWFMDLGKEHEASINSLLSRSWPRIQIALQSSGQADCQKASGMSDFLKEQHIIMTMVMLNIPGVRLEVEQRKIYNDMLTNTLTQLAEGKLKVCSGDTANTVPMSGRIINYG